MKDGEPLQLDHTRDIRQLRAGRILQIVSAAVADSGIYTCVVENKAGQDQRRYVLHVHGSAYLLTLYVSYSRLLFMSLSYSQLNFAVVMFCLK